MYFALGFFCTYIVLSLQPYLPLMLRGKGFNPSMVGILLGLFEAAGIAGPFVFSFFADRWGRYKPGLIITHLMIFACLPPLLFFRNPLVIALFMALMGAGLRSIFPLFDAMCTISIGDSGDYGKLRTAGSASYIMMMLFFQFSPLLRPNTPFNIICWLGITTLVSLAAIACIPARYTNTGGRSPQSPDRTRRTGGSFWSPMLILGLVIIALSRLSMVSIHSFFSMFLVEYLRWDAVGMLSAIATGCEIPLMFLSKKLISRFGALSLLALASAAIMVRLGIFALLPVKGWIIAAQFLHSLCYGLFYPAGISFIAGCVPPERRALGMTLFVSIGTGLPTFAGTILGGFIIEYLGYRPLFGIFSAFSLAALGIYALIILAKKRKPVYHTL
jgi:PPP family 3-phenylpropionic acid transporter